MSIETLDKGDNMLRSANMRLENDEICLQVEKVKGNFRVWADQAISV